MAKLILEFDMGNAAFADCCNGYEAARILTKLADNIEGLDLKGGDGGGLLADSSGKWAGNAVRLATREEAEAYAKDLFSRWMLVTDTRVVESPDPVNYRFDVQTWKLTPVEGADPAV